VAAGFLAEAFLLRSSLDQEEVVGEAGEVEPPMIDEDPHTAAGIRLSGSRREGWLEVEARVGWGDGLASSGQRLRAGWEGEAIGGADVEVERERWGGEALSNVHGRAWTRPLWGASLFAEAESGRRGVPASPFLPRDDEIDGEPELPMEDGAPDPSVTDRSGYRAGIELRRGDLVLGAAWLRVEADSLHPTGLPFDRGAEPVRGGERTGVEALVRIPLTPLLPGLELAGSVQRWDRTREWRYLPRHRYQGGVHFHDVFLESGNLEVWADVAVGGRDPMSVPLRPEEGGATSGSVPFQQSWSARIQIRIVSARVFVLWENFTLRENNQDVPGRLLPATRALYGVRWTLWN
jgi:hypothetical protein